MFYTEQDATLFHANQKKRIEKNRGRYPISREPMSTTGPTESKEPTYRKTGVARPVYTKRFPGR